LVGDEWRYGGDCFIGFCRPEFSKIVASTFLRIVVPTFLRNVVPDEDPRAKGIGFWIPDQVRNDNFSLRKPLPLSPFRDDKKEDSSDTTIGKNFKFTVMILVINCGSTTLKFRIFDSELKELAGGLVDRLGQPRTRLDCQVGKKSERRTFAGGLTDQAAALSEVFSVLTEAGFETSDITSVGHRVVHGGEEFVRPTRLTREVLRRLRKYSRLAPLHNPANLAGIEAAAELLPDVEQVAVFDTAFFSTLPDYAFIYALPWEYYSRHGIRKYGFHGISHRYVSEEAARRLHKPLGRVNLITCHLGGGSSVTAIEGGQAVDTSMGFTPLQGLTMATRCGDIDPSIPLFMVDTLGLTVDEAHDVLNHDSGLKGLTGHADLREVLVQLGEGIGGFGSRRRPTKSELERSQVAVDKLCYDVARYIGSYTALLGRVDAVVFTGGVGENSASIRRRVMARLKLRPKLKTLVVPTNEELMIAREVKAVGVGV